MVHTQAVAELPDREKELNGLTRIFELTDKHPSSYILEGTEGTNDEVRLECAKLRRLPNISKMWVGKGQNRHYERIQYIKGCNEILISKQKELGIFPNSQTGTDEIWVVGGKLLLTDDGGDESILYKYLQNAQFNETNPNRDPSSTILIRELQNEKEAEESLDEFMTFRKAMNVVDSLVQEKTKGGGYNFDTERINYLCDLFGITGFLEEEYKSKTKALVEFAKANPVNFLKSIADKAASVMVDVEQGFRLGVLAFEESKVMLGGTKVIMAVTAKDTDEKKKELADYLMTPTGHKDYQQLMISIQNQQYN